VRVPSPRHVRGTIAALLVTLVGASGCSPVLDTVDDAALRGSGDYRMVDALSVPEVTGAAGCGAQALATALAFADRSIAADAMAEELPWHDLGATPVDILLAARKRGFDARVARGTWETLAARIDDGSPALVMLDVGIEIPTMTSRIPTRRAMHWAVVGGVAVDDTRVLLAAPQERHHVVERRDFMRRWERSDFCMIVVEPPRATAAFPPLPEMP
jgi:predicted double-glycine peptidase